MLGVNEIVKMLVNWNAFNVQCKRKINSNNLKCLKNYELLIWFWNISSIFSSPTSCASFWFNFSCILHKEFYVVGMIMWRCCKSLYLINRVISATFSRLHRRTLFNFWSTKCEINFTKYTPTHTTIHSYTNTISSWEN